MDDSYNQELAATKSEHSRRDSQVDLAQYRSVNLALKIFLTGNLVMLPSLTLIMLVQFLGPENATGLLIFAAVGAFTAALLIFAASLGLLATPKRNEKTEVVKYLLCMGLALALHFANLLLGELWQLDLGKKLAQTLGALYLIRYFEVLAFNFQSYVLVDSSHAFKQFYKYGVLAALGLMIATLIVPIPIPAVVAVFLVVFICAGFLYHWNRTVWYAIRVTKGVVYRQAELD